jgi:hypothetical protein
MEILITGIPDITEQRQAKVGTAIMISLAHTLDGETDDVAIAFNTEEVF